MSKSFQRSKNEGPLIDCLSLGPSSFYSGDGGHGLLYLPIREDNVECSQNRTMCIWCSIRVCMCIYCIN